MNPDNDMDLCCVKLVEVLLFPEPSGDPLRRLKNLAVAAETFAESATSPLEQQLAQSLRRVTEHFLRDAAAWSFDEEAPAVRRLLNVEPAFTGPKSKGQ